MEIRIATGSMNSGPRVADAAYLPRATAPASKHALVGAFAIFHWGVIHALNTVKSLFAFMSAGSYAPGGHHLLYLFVSFRVLNLSYVNSS